MKVTNILFLAWGEPADRGDGAHDSPGQMATTNLLTWKNKNPEVTVVTAGFTSLTIHTAQMPQQLLLTVQSPGNKYA